MCVSKLSKEYHRDRDDDDDAHDSDALSLSF